PRRKGKRLPIVRTHRVLAVLIQATGLERRPPCDRCSRAKGPWKECVAVLSPEGAQATRGACANCLWNNQGSLCSFSTLSYPFALSSVVLPISQITPPPSHRTPPCKFPVRHQFPRPRACYPRHDGSQLWESAGPREGASVR
ncbi:hypothetical protein CMEL01_16763, partial [Colletotrichum melonis]